MYRHDAVISVSPQRLVNGKGIMLGRSVSGKPVSIDPDWLERHLLILGKTGTGKSNLLLQILRSVVSSGNGSVVLFDPHGKLGKTAVTMFPEQSVIVSPMSIDAEGNRSAIQLNAINNSGGGSLSELSAGWVKDAFTNEGVFSQGTWGPRLEVVFTSILSEIIRSRENANLGDLLELLTDSGKMRRFISSLEDPQLKSFLKMQISDWRGWNQYVSSSVNKLLPLLTNQGIRNLISSRQDTINLTSVLGNPGTIVVPEIWRDSVPEETYKIITVLILLKIWLGRFGKKDQASLYIIFDEAQLVPTGILDRLLREGRKFGLRIIMATQFLGTEMKELSETLRGNVSNVINFSLLEKDAETISYNFFSGDLAKKLSSVLKSQPVHRSVLWSQNTEGISGPLSFVPEFDEQMADDKLFSQVRQRNVEKYGAYIGKETRLVQHSDLHEFLVVEFQKFLQLKSIQPDRNVSVEGIYPDLYFSHNARTFFVEVEVSDLVNFSRIWKKLLDYSGKPLVFITPPGHSSDLFNRILERLSESQNLNLKNGDLLSNVTVIEYDNGFLFYAAGKLRQLKLEFLQNGSFSRSLDELRHSEVRSFIYSKFVKRNSYRMNFPLEEVEKVFGRKNMLKARNYLCGSSDFITVKDLFRVKSSD